MQRVVMSEGWSASAGGRAVAVTASLVAMMALAACTSTGQKGESHSPAPGSSAPGTSPQPDPSTSASSKPAAAAAVITAAAVGGAKRANPAKPVVVTVHNGTLTSVKLVNGAGKVVSGTTSRDSSSWRTTEPLGYGKTYTLTAMAKDEAGAATVEREKITTVTPDNMTMPYLNSTAGTSLRDGATYGVGIVPVVHFDEPITDKTAAERALSVTTSPRVDGAWYWVDDQSTHWRPRTFFEPGTKVRITANVYGVQVGPGLYGQSDQGVSFTIGAKQVSIADDKTKTVKVYFGGKLIRTMPVSMGRGGYVPGKDGLRISLWTMPGVYTVIGKENPATASSESYGLPASSPDGYGPLKLYSATRISTDGIYLHSAPWSVGDQGRRDVSHGCLNLSPRNAAWYYRTAHAGDVVQVKNTGGPGIKIWQNGDWSVPWSTWVNGGAK